MSVTKISDTRWRARIYEGKTALISRNFADPADAHAWERRMRRDLAAGVDVVAASKTVGEWIPAFLHHRESAVAPSTLERDRTIVEHWPQWFRGYRVADVTPAVIARLIDVTPGSPGTKQRALITSGALWAWLVSMNVVERSPVRGVKVAGAKAIGSSIEPFSWTEVEAMAAQIPKDRTCYADAILVLAYTGLRWGELRALTPADIVRGDSGEPIAIRVRHSASDGFPEKAPKSGRVRKVPLMQRPAEIIAERMRGKRQNEPIFTAPRGGALNKANMRRSVRWEEISGGRRLHDLRHTAACMWLRKGVDIATVSSWLGHASVSTTGVYLHLVTTEQEKRLVAALDDSAAGRAETA